MPNPPLSSPAPRGRLADAGGTLTREHLYVERAADRELLDLCLRREYVHILVSRQMGKSSLIARTVDRLSESGIRAVHVDLSGTGSGTEERWYFTALSQIFRKLGEDIAPIDASYEANKGQTWTAWFGGWLEALAAKSSAPLVVFLDEIESLLRLPFKDDFFRAIRSLYNQRTQNAILARLSFVLVGSTSPGSLVRDIEQTTFNIGTAVILSDFTEEEALELTAALPSGDPELAKEAVRRVLDWTGGQPYLTVKTLAALAAAKPFSVSEDAVHQVVSRLFFGARMREQDRNLDYVRKMLVGSEFSTPPPRGTLDLYDAIIHGRKLLDRPQDPKVAWLKLAGAVVPGPDGRLTVRNRIYRTVFDAAWVGHVMPPKPLVQTITRFAERYSLWLAASLALFVVLAAIAVRFYFQADNAFRNSILALNDSRARTASAQALVALSQNRKVSSLLLALESWRLKKSTEADLTVQRALRAPLSLECPGCGPVQWNPAANQIAAASANEVIIWDAPAGRVVRRLEVYSKEEYSGRDSIVFSMAWSPSGKHLAVGAAGRIQIWDLQGTSPPRLFLESEDNGRDPEIRALAWNPRGTVLAGGYDDGAIRLWDFSSGKARALDVRPGAITSLAWNPGGSRLISGTANGEAHLWASTSGSLLHTYRDRQYDSTSTSLISSLNVAWSPDGEWVVLTGAGEGGMIRKGSLTRVLLEQLKYESSFDDDGTAIVEASWSPNGRFLAGITSSGAVIIWPCNERKRLMFCSSERLELGVHPRRDYPRGLTWSRDSERVAIKTNGSVIVYNASYLFGSPIRDVGGIRWNSDGSQLAAAVNTNGRSRIELIDPSTHTVTNTVDVDLSTPSVRRNILDLIDHRQLAGVRWRFNENLFLDPRRTLGGIGIGDPLNMWLRQLGLPRCEMVSPVAFSSPDGRRLGVLERWPTCTSRIIDVETGTPLLTLGGKVVHEISWSRDSARVAVVAHVLDEGAGRRTSCLSEDRVTIFDSEKWTVAGQTQGTHVEWSPDGKQLAVSLGNTPRAFTLLDSKTLAPLTRLQNPRCGASRFRWNPDSRTIASAPPSGEKGSLCTWDLSQGGKLWIVGREPAEITDFAWHPNGKLLGVAFLAHGVPPAIEVWDTATLAPVRLIESISRVERIYWSPRGKLASVDRSGQLRIWEDADELMSITCRDHIPRNFTGDEWAHYFGPQYAYHRTCENLPKATEATYR